MWGNFGKVFNKSLQNIYLKKALATKLQFGSTRCWTSSPSACFILGNTNVREQSPEHSMNFNKITVIDCYFSGQHYQRLWCNGIQLVIEQQTTSKTTDEEQGKGVTWPWTPQRSNGPTNPFGPFGIIQKGGQQHHNSLWT